MKKLTSLPKSVKKYLDECSADNEQLICYAESDLTETGGFEEGYLILSDRNLYYVVCETLTEDIHRLGGNYLEYDTPGEVIGAKKYAVDDVKELEVISEVARHYLRADTEEGWEKISFFSGTARKDIYQLTKEFKHLKTGEEIERENDDDLHCPKCGTLYPDPDRKVCPKCMNKSSIFFRMLGYMKPYLWKMIIMAVCFVGMALLNLAWPYLSGTVLYDRILVRDESFLSWVEVPGNRFVFLLGMSVICMFLARALRQVLGVIQGVLVAQVVPDIVYKMKTEVFASMGKMELHFFTNNKTGSLMTRVMDDANRVSGLFIDGLPYFVIDLLSIIVMVVVMLILNPLLTIVIMLILPLITVFSFRMMPSLTRVNTRQHQARRRMNAQVNDNITGARVVKAFGKESGEDKRFVRYNKGVRDAAMEMAVLDNKFYMSYMICRKLASLSAWCIGGALILSGADMEVGMLITFTGYISQMEDPLDYFSHLFRWFSRSMNSAQRIFEIIDAVPKIREKADAYHPERIEGSIDFEHVTFGYEPGKAILKDVSFHVDAGNVLGIVGKSGAGKTTLVSLLSRLYDPDEGKILIDGVNVKDMGIAELRKSIAMVSQETYIFSGTIAENIAYAKPDATKEEIVAAAMKAGAHNFICKTEDGYDTLVGAQGRELSGGERQRVSIARAILADPRILILDEATSAVDTETELIIQKSIEELTKGRTTISIAHRLSTLRNADSLIVMDEGRITEEGTHEELLEKHGTFWTLMDLQTTALAMRGVD